MNHRGSHRKQQQRDRNLQQASTSQQNAEGERKRECDYGRREKHYSIQSQRLVNYPDDRIVEPFPGQPWPSAHGVGERIGPRDHVRAQHEFTIADVPSDSSISQQTRGKHTVAQQSWRFSSVLCRLKPLISKSDKKPTKFAERTLVMHSLCVWASI